MTILAGVNLHENSCQIPVVPKTREIINTVHHSSDSRSSISLYTVPYTVKKQVWTGEYLRKKNLVLALQNVKRAWLQ